MFLIEYKKGGFIDGRSIQWLSIGSDRRVNFTIFGDDDLWEVDADLSDSFLNHLQHINQSGINVQDRYKELKQGH